jgi:hypothetical protein
VPREERLEILRKCHSVEYGGLDTTATFGPKQKCGLADSIGRRCMKILKDMLHHASIPKNRKYLSKKFYALEI